MEELVYIIDLVNNFLLGDPNINVNYSIAPMAIMGALKLGSTFIGRGARRREQGLADAEFAAAKRRFEGLDTSNVYAGLQNTMEDLTVNTQAADFAAQQQQQSLANTMGAMSGAAGGSGIAALAQAMAGQQSQNLQQASASIAQQEQANQMAAAQQGMQIQQLKGKGELFSQQAKMSHEQELYGLAQGRKQAADAATAAATQAQIGAVTSMVAPGGDLGGGMLGGLGKKLGAGGKSGILGGIGKIFGG
jgi:hypothetical protein